MPLTPRQLEILCLYGRGLRRPEIAALLHLSTRTVTNHVNTIKLRLGTRTVAQSIVVSQARGYLKLDDKAERVVLPSELVAA